ncbi:ubiquitin carboxyl-terminal hydrolase 17 isoform X2 [Prosopis cineraria]|uniref:ubiquitin carboxyl-terminal hydrolase 17 isoform X2 n=1 Tax=Prosopis cineraria TaxID=364024 RepID=UPI00240F7B55|nr:ubiquitin carboxyl-terminal hydrolase 17 isoform X2 [Prosopis cineraria]
MRVTEDLGFSSLVLVVVCFVVPVIGFVIHRKWQFALARQEEIKRLLILAAEEAARAESEASYAYATFSAPKINQCVVCYSPTTTRCSRCKAVRYCSGKCQIIHWRQGHKEECHPPSTTCQDDDVFDDHMVAEKDRCRILEEKSEVEGTRCETVSKKTPLSGINSPEVTCGKDDINSFEPLAAGNITDSNSELSSNSFSGFSSSTVASESSDDASVCESVVSSEPERSEGHIFADPALDMHDANSSDNSMDMTMPSLPKFANSVDAIDGFSSMRNLNQTRPSFSKEKGKLAKNGSSCLSVGQEVTIEHHTVSSGFWDKTLDSEGTNGDAKNELLPSHSDESTDHQKPGCGSSICVSVNILPPMHVQGQEEEDSAADNCVLNSAGNMASAGSALSENDSMDSLKRQISTSLDHKGSNSPSFMRKDNCGSPSSFVHHSSSVGKKSGFADSSSISNLQSAGSKASNNILVDPDSASHQLESVEVRYMPSPYADAHLESRTKNYAHSSTISGNNAVQPRITTSSQVASRSPTPKNGLKTSMLKVVDQFKGSNSSKRLPLAVGSDVTGRYSDKGLFSYDLFVKLYNWNKAELQPFGLVNCGNSCYANAVLQCLAFTPPLTAYLLQGLHSKACANKKGCFTCEFESLVLKSKGTKSALSPKGILSQLQNIGSRLGNGREEDAHEFLRSAIDTMQLVCLAEAGLNASGSSEEETTLMGLTFGGYLRSKIKCMRCGGKSERQERMMDLTVAIEGEITTLEEALRQFTSTESLEGENKYHCVRCKSYENAKKKLTVSEAPNILTIALKRFQSGKFGKLNKPIRFPEILDLAPFMSGTSDKSPIYRLYGVVVHLDIMNAAFSGHYVCYVKNSQNKWFKVDDSVVTAVELERVLTKGAYMLLYARCSPRAPRLIRNTISNDSKSKAANGKITIMKSRYVPTNSVAAEYFPSSVSPNGSPTLDPFNSKFHHLKRILVDDSSSDNSSLISTNSDEGSCSTDSTRYSTSTDDFSEYIFGESGCSWNNTWKNSDSDSSSSSSSSPLNLRHSPLSDKVRYGSGFPDINGLRTPAGSSLEAGSPLYRDYTGVNRVADTERGVTLLRSNTNIHVRKLGNSRSNSIISRETNYFQGLGSNHFSDKNYGASCIKSRERTG